MNKTPPIVKERPRKFRKSMFSNISEPECFVCDKIVLELFDTADSSQGSRAGLYEETTPVNGRKSWTSDNNAIWWMSSLGKWVIGPASNIGENNGALFSDDPFDPDSDCPQQVSKWEVWTGTEFISSTGVSFECYTGN